MRRWIEVEGAAGADSASVAGDRESGGAEHDGEPVGQCECADGAGQCGGAEGAGVGGRMEICASSAGFVLLKAMAYNLQLVRSEESLPVEVDKVGRCISGPDFCLPRNFRKIACHRSTVWKRRDVD